jgi:O-antigen/teichoic acid export membrane protein
MTGTTIAQAIPIAISPILTRIYTPEDFGVFALYMAIVSIIAVVATGRYEMAIMLPKKDSDAINIVALSILISFFVSFISLVIVFVFNSQITNLLNNPEISNWLYFIPITVLLTGIYQSFNYWSNRKKQYKRLATSRVVQSSTTASANLGMGFCGLGSSGLIVGQVLGQSISATILGKLIWNEDKEKCRYIKISKILALANRYIRFPRYDIFASILNVSSHKITHVLFNSLFNSTVAGYFFLMQKILSLPLVFISSAIADVFRQSASYEFSQYKNCKNIFMSTLKKLFMLSLIPVIILYLFSVELFTFIFGDEWKIAGEYAKTFAPVLMIQFISSPLSIVFYIAEKQNINLYLQILLIVLVLISMFIASSPEIAVFLLSLSMGLYYFIQLSFSACYAGVFKNV